MGVVHCINVDEKLDSFDGLLEKYATSCELVNRPQNILVGIEKNLQRLEIEPKKSIKIKAFSHGKTIDETLSKAENELSEIETSVALLAEPLDSYSKIIRKIDLLLTSWKINRKKLPFSGKPIPKESIGEVLQEAEQKIFEIETRFKEIDTISIRGSKILTRIDKLAKKLKIKPTDYPTNEVHYSVDEKFLDFIEQTLLPFEKKSRTKKPFKYSNSKQLMTMKAHIGKILEKIPQERTDIIKQMLKLRKSAELGRQSIKSKPEFTSVQSKLLALRTLIQEVEELRKIEGHLGSVASTVYLEAWVPKKNLRKVTNGIKEVTKGVCMIKEEPPDPEETVPTIIKPAPRLLEAFEKLTFSFGYPKPDEINPVFIMAVTFPLLFGIMFADVGQGVILLVAGLVLSYFRRKVDIEEVGDIPRYLLVGSGLIVLCGISSTFFGFLFGEFFGPSGIIHPISLGQVGPFQIGGFDPMLEPVSMLRLGIFVGVCLLSFSLILRIFNNVRKSQFKQTLISISWLWLLIGGFILWIYWGGISNLTKWFGEGIFMFIGLVILPVIIMTITTAVAENVMGGIQFSIEILIESLDHTISFGRLAALSLTHSALNYMFLILGGVEHSNFTLQAIPIVIVGSILALTIEGLIIFVHTLRLHWVEWLPGFYSGKGIPFKPINLNNTSKEQYEYGS
jgi:vacuolar-type H+-ATPase subunit I/STV1